MAETIGYDEICRMITGAAERIRAGHKELSKLDSAIGDGDHGMAMLRAMDAAQKAVDEDKASEIKSLLYNVGWGVMSIDGGSTGPLLGSFFMGMSEGAGDKELLNCDDVAKMFEAALANVRKQTKAQPGDKTMIDALVPAVEELGADACGDVAETMKHAADAASRGAEATQQMQAVFGRAKNLGPRSIGHMDPGAVSISYLFRGFAEAFSTGK